MHGEKIRRTNIRFNRVDIFLNYLKRQEEIERKNNKKIECSEEFSEINCLRILDQYEKEKKWIRSRLKENAVKYAETLSSTFEIENDNETEQFFINAKEEEEEEEDDDDDDDDE